MQLWNVLIGLASLCSLVLPTTGARISKRDRLSKRVPSSHTIHERHEARNIEGWVKRKLADAESTVPVRIGLKQSNVDAGHDLLMDISDPRSPNYGKHLSRREVIDLFAPNNHSVAKVKRWLVSEGIDERRISQSANKQWIQFDAPVYELEEILLTRYHIFENLETGVQNIACSEYHVPRNVSRHIDYITPGIKLMSGGYEEKLAKRVVNQRSIVEDLGSKSKYAPGETDQSRRKGKCKPNSPAEPVDENSPFRVTGPCSDAITPHCIRAQYQIPNGTRARRGNELGIFQGLGQHYSQADLNNYWKYIAPWVPRDTHPELRSINGALGPTNDTLKAGEEADLDFEIAIPLIWPQRTVLFQTDDEWYQKDQQRADSKYPGFFNTFFDAIDESYCHLTAFNMTGNCAMPECRDPDYPNPNATPAEGGYKGALMCGRYRPTSVISISYSGTEHSWPENYTRRQCLEVLKLALQGVTVVESSGDFGVGGKRWDPHGGCLGERKDVFSPRVMSNCPYVLSVGATALVQPEAVNPDENEVKLVEVAARSFASGGGFSNVFARPSWQDRHVREYLARANLSAMGYENAAGIRYDSLRPRPTQGQLFNRLGRGYPDVAAVGENYRVVLRGNPNRMQGTSASTPVWASILTLINEERRAAGKSTVGFVHQVLYQHPEVFTDITTGSNPGCGSNGFPAKEGWDPVTGLGSPIYPKLLKLFMSLP
ncbi:peptidase S8/S53 domain-containing protein [Corynascus novoguineensis]|uniref:Peptidase S8/S53 domain-containing protein n=1 Tax=Corynascus novoguineensis TaxID=1126955 RepID=A0AAN7HLR7_9PEZI|nr:peptidase S8/S53 domain-containing protein [Corynascus novoguineensis]